jgi:DNA-binding NtrC family response regulator
MSQTCPSSYSVLVVEDDPMDSLIMQRAFRTAHELNIKCVSTDRLSTALECLRNEMFHAVLLDLNLPDSTGEETFLALQSEFPDVPVVVLSGHRDDQLASSLLRKGAQDFLEKSPEIGAAVVRIIYYTIERHRFLNEIKANERMLSEMNQALEKQAVERENLVAQLRATLEEVKNLSGLLPVCAWCKKIRTDKGYWESVETYLNKRVHLTHGICPECEKSVTGDMNAGLI